MKTTIVGFGGTGCRIVDILSKQHPGSNFIAINSDEIMLSKLDIEKKFLITPIKRSNEAKAVVEMTEDVSIDKLFFQRANSLAASFFQNSTIIFEEFKQHEKMIWVAGLGGCFGSTIFPFALKKFQEISWEHNWKQKAISPILSLPFRLEGMTRTICALNALKRIGECKAGFYLFNNDNLHVQLNEQINSTLHDAFRLADNELVKLVNGVDEIM